MKTGKTGVILGIHPHRNPVYLNLRDLQSRNRSMIILGRAGTGRPFKVPHRANNGRR